LKANGLDLATLEDTIPVSTSVHSAYYVATIGVNGGKKLDRESFGVSLERCLSA